MPEPTEVAEPTDEVDYWKVSTCKNCGRRIRQPSNRHGVAEFTDAAWRHLAMGPVWCSRPAKPLPMDLEKES